MQAGNVFHRVDGCLAPGSGQQQHFGRQADGSGANALGAVRHDILSVIARIERGLENFDLLPGNARAREAPNQLLGLARKHGAANHFQPAPARSLVTRTNAGFNKHYRR